MLQLFDQTDRFDLERADSLMTNWRRWGELRKKRIMSPTWIVMNSIRNHSGHKEENEQGFASSNPWDFSEMPDEIEALRVEALFCLGGICGSATTMTGKTFSRFTSERGLSRY